MKRVPSEIKADISGTLESEPLDIVSICHSFPPSNFVATRYSLKSVNTKSKSRRRFPRHRRFPVLHWLRRLYKSKYLAR